MHKFKGQKAVAQFTFKHFPLKRFKLVTFLSYPFLYHPRPKTFRMYEPAGAGTLTGSNKRILLSIIFTKAYSAQNTINLFQYSPITVEFWRIITALFCFIFIFDFIELLWHQHTTSISIINLRLAFKQNILVLTYLPLINNSLRYKLLFWFTLVL